MIPCYHTPVRHSEGTIVNKDYPYAVFLFGDDPENPTGEGRMCALCNTLYVVNLSLQRTINSAVASSGVIKTGVGDIQKEM